jgi:hypothetical protein
MPHRPDRIRPPASATARLLCLAALAVTVGCGKRPMSVADSAPPRHRTDSAFEYYISTLRAPELFNLRDAAGQQPKPALTASHVTDVPARFVADPFLWPAPGGGWHLFFEVLNASNGRGEIALARSADGLDWTYDRIVLAEPFHLSYPLVFEWDGQIYMLPETWKDGAVQIYKAHDYPYDWRPHARLIEKPHVDSTLFRRDGRWWILASNVDSRNLHLYFSDHLDRDWTEHPQSPVVLNNRQTARLGGRAFEADSRLYRVAQDCLPRYGYQVRLFEISTLTLRDYAETEISESPVLHPDDLPWADWGTHHFDPWRSPGNDAWLVAIDGYGPSQPDLHLDIPFSDGSRLDGFTLRTRTPAPGDHLFLHFFWDVPPQDPLALFVHFHAEGRLVFQADHLPSGRKDYHLVPKIPENAPSGPYDVSVGVYDPSDPRRLPSQAIRLPLPFEVRPPSSPFE